MIKLYIIIGAVLTVLGLLIGLVDSLKKNKMDEYLNMFKSIPRIIPEILKFLWENKRNILWYTFVTGLVLLIVLLALKALSQLALVAIAIFVVLLMIIIAILNG